MASITIKNPISIAGVAYDSGDVVSVSAHVARVLTAEGQARYTTPRHGVLPNGPGLQFLETITSLTGNTATSLDGYETMGVATGRRFSALIDGVRRSYELVAKGSLVVDGDGVVEPIDYDASENNRVFRQFE